MIPDLSNFGTWIIDGMCMYILFRRDCGVMVRHDDSWGEVGKDLSPLAPVPHCGLRHYL